MHAVRASTVAALTAYVAATSWALHAGKP